ncbi:MAG: hypothetical protein ACK5V3_17940 [Bdellovibrionales bacterium]
MKMISPYEVFSGDLQFAEIPELASFNAKTDPEMRGIMYTLAKKGIAIGLGDNPNRDSYFDLSSEVVDIILKEPPAAFGVPTPDRKTEVGRLHFLTHDPVHFVPDIPGLRLKHLENIQETEKRIWKILLVKEALASAWSTQYYVQKYWNWRNQQRGEYPQETFEKANNGLASIGDFTKAEYMDLVLAAVTGQVSEYFKLAKKSLNFEAYLRARDAGVPMVLPRLDEKMPPALEKLVIKHGLAPLMTIVNYIFPKTGHLAFSRYAKMQAAFYVQPWYIKWNHEFQIGEDIDTLEKNLEKSMQEFRDDVLLRNVEAPPAGLFEIMHIRNNIAHIGRKLIELQVLGEQNPGIHSEAQKASIQLFIDYAKKINEELLKFKDSKSPISSTSREMAIKSYDLILRQLEHSIPIDKFIPRHLKLGMADYEHFWKDIHAVVLPRPEMMTKFMSAKGVWRRALVQRFTGVIPEARPAGKERIKDMEEALATRYNKNRVGAVLATSFSELNSPIQKLEEYVRLASHQVENVYLTQVQENLDIDFETRKKLALEALQFVKEMKIRVQSITSGELNPTNYLLNEKSLIRYIEVKMVAYAHIIELLENRRGQKRVLQAFETSLQAEKSAESQKQFKNSIVNQAKEYCSLLARACLRKDGKVILMGQVDYEGIENFSDEILKEADGRNDMIDLINVKKSGPNYVRSEVKEYLPVRKALEIKDCRSTVSIKK